MCLCKTAKTCWPCCVAESVVGDEPFLVMLADDLSLKEVNNSHLLVKAYEKEKTQLSVMEVNDKAYLNME